MEEFIDQLNMYLPIDFGDAENNEYRTYLIESFKENYLHEKYQFSLIAFHMLFMSFLYKEFWILKTFRKTGVEKLCKLNGKFNDIEKIHDASIISEKEFVKNYLSVFAWHVNKKSAVEDFVNRRDKCAHSSGFVQFHKKEVDIYFDEVIENAKKISQGNKDNIASIFSESIMLYLNSDAFESTLMGDFIEKQLLDKKYSYKDLEHILASSIPKQKGQNKKIAYLFAMLQLEILYKENWASDAIETLYVNEICEYITSLTDDEKVHHQIQLEDEYYFLEQKRCFFDIEPIKELLESFSVS